MARKSLCIITFIFLVHFSSGQEAGNISTLDFVEILYENRDEAVYYYQNNWRVHREKALKRNVIASFQIMEVIPSEEAPFHLILITTYKDKVQYDSRKANFEDIMKDQKELNLLNEIEPKDFRKVVFNKRMASHLVNGGSQK